MDKTRQIIRAALSADDLLRAGIESYSVDAAAAKVFLDIAEKMYSSVNDHWNAQTARDWRSLIRD
jgi:hypothetical protein